MSRAAFSAAPPTPRGQGGQQRVQRGVLLVAQAEQGGQAVAVAALHRVPERGVGRVGGGRGGALGVTVSGQ
ncbi:hypothetical protein ACFQFC_41065 [Amorphoplanes digitatis]|uniref:hypothetical protein n=1 Tax=Actinoplanes digitatis TaxID=1868 RepID=UPI00361156A0